MKTPVTIALLALTFLLLAGCMGGNVRPESGWAAPVLSESLVFISSQDGRVVSLNAQSCAPVFGTFPQEQQDPLKGIYGTPSLEANTLFVGSYDDSVGMSKLYALNAADLNADPYWVFPQDEQTDIRQIVAGSVVADGKVIFGSSDGSMRAINVATGQLAWSPFKTNDKIWSTPTVDSDTIYFGSLDHGLYAISVADGSPRWAGPFQTNGGIVSSPLVVEGRVYFGSFDRNFYAVDARSGTQVWKFPREGQGNAWFWSSPVIDMERRAVYIGDMDGMLYALDIDTGAKQWEFDLENPIISTPVMVDGLLVVASDGGLVYVISPAASVQQPPFIDVKAKVRAPLQAKDGIVYIHAMNQRVTALRVGRTTQDKLWEYDTKTGECSR